MESKHPTAKDLGLASIAILNGLFDYQKHHLVGGTLLPSKVDNTDPHVAWEGLTQHLSGIQAINWALSQQPIGRMIKLLSGRAKANPEGQIASLDAEWRLVGCTLSVLAFFYSHREKGIVPGAMYDKDWSDAIRAVGTLARLQRNHGLNVNAVLFGSDSLTSLPIDWPTIALERLKLAKAAAMKPCNDDTALKRRTLRNFVISFYQTFREAPTETMACRFGELIDYVPGTIKRKIPEWIEDSSLPY